ncbi:hypothetical protein BJX96DRAFT_147668 [Aspergillus floccosus]
MRSPDRARHWSLLFACLVSFPSILTVVPACLSTKRTKSRYAFLFSVDETSTVLSPNAE